MAAFLDDFILVSPVAAELVCLTCNQEIGRANRRSLAHLIQQAHQHQCPGFDVDFNDASYDDVEVTDG
jgi:hypothetical protein